MNEEFRERLEKAADNHLYQWDVRHGEYPDYLWHYTSISGVKGILTEGHLWFSDAIFLNDSSELAYAVDIAEEVIKQRAESTETKPIVQDYLQAFLIEIKNDRSQRHEYGFGVKPAFVACFCEQGDSLHLWRAYTGNGRGYSIGFFPDLVLAQLKPLHVREAIYIQASEKTSRKSPSEAKIYRPRESPIRIYKPALRKVIYGIEEQKEILGRAIDSFGQIINDFESELPTGSLYDLEKIVFRSNLYRVFYQYLCCFKHPSFKEEREWRFIYTPTTWAELKAQEEVSVKNIEYREAGGYIVPYLKVNIAEVSKGDTNNEQIVEKERISAIDLPFETIITGPGLNERLAKASLYSFLLRRGYLGRLINIEHSFIPLRNM